MIATPAMESHLRALSALSARVGADPMLVQGGGGNLSLKEDNVLWVKASGKWMANAQREPIFVPVALQPVRDAVAAGDADPVNRHVLDDGGLRPSIETTLHALLPHRVVIHAHSIHALAAAVRRDGREWAARRLQGLDWQWVPYCTPGLPLTRAIAALGSRAPAIVLLANHGLVVGADTLDAAEATLHDVEQRLSTVARIAPEADLQGLANDARADIAATAGWSTPRDARIHGLATDPISLRHARKGPLFPDQVVFLGPELPVSDDARGCCRLLPGRGVLVRPDITAGQEEMLLCLALLYSHLDEDAPLVTLEESEVAALMGWEAERYRVSLDARRR